MITFAVVAGVIALAAGAADWIAVANDDTARRRWTKPLPMVLLLAAVAVIVADAMPGGVWLLTAIVLGLAGDVFLLGEGESRFMAGLGAFAAGHLCYVVTALVVGVDATTALIGVPFLVALLGWRFATRTVPGARRHGGALLAGLVVFYAVIISAMVLTATGTGYVAAAVGAMLFAVSDWLLGYQRFVGPLGRRRVHHRDRRDHRATGGAVAVMVTYHVGQTLLALALALALRA